MFDYVEHFQHPVLNITCNSDALIAREVNTFRREDRGRPFSRKQLSQSVNCGLGPKERSGMCAVLRRLRRACLHLHSRDQPSRALSVCSLHFHGVSRSGRTINGSGNHVRFRLSLWRTMSLKGFDESCLCDIVTEFSETGGCFFPLESLARTFFRYPRPCLMTGIFKFTCFISLLG